MADRQFLFNYRFANAEWGITIFASDPAEAKEKIKAVALARFEGEVYYTFKMPMGGLLRKLFFWRS